MKQSGKDKSDPSGLRRSPRSRGESSKNIVYLIYMGIIKERVRDLRKKQTPAEQYFWNEVRSNKLGFSFRRQYPLVFYIGDTRKLFVADFFCKEKNLVIEIDGKIHEKQKEYDEARTFIINDLGYTVMRFSNEQILNNFTECANSFLRLAGKGGSAKAETERGQKL